MSSTLLVDWPVGSDMGFVGGYIHELIGQALEKGMRVVQFMLGDPNKYFRDDTLPRDLQFCRNILQRHSMHVFSHFNLQANLAGTTRSLAWNGDHAQDNRTRYTLRTLEHELRILAQIRPDNSRYKQGVVIHPGSYPDKSAGLQAIIQSLDQINFPPGSILLLENASGDGNKLASTLEELQVILHGVKESQRHHLRICIDTCHLFARGQYDLRRVEEVDRFFRTFDELIGLEWLYLIHLNDSMAPFGTKVDRHASLGAGQIWMDNWPPLLRLLNFCRDRDIPLVLETHPNDMFVLGALSENLPIQSVQ